METVCKSCGWSGVPSAENLKGDRLICPACGAEMLSLSVFYEQFSDFEIANTAVVRYVGRGGSVTVPPFITEIAPSAFKNSAVSSVILPFTVVSVGDQAFDGCASLSAVKLSNVHTIGRRAFGNCALSQLVLPTTVERIGAYAFFDCRNLVSVCAEKGNSIVLGEYAFGRCVSLCDVRLERQNVQLGECALFGCASLKDIRIVCNKKTDKIGLGKRFLEGCDTVTVTISGKKAVLKQFAEKYGAQSLTAMWGG